MSTTKANRLAAALNEVAGIFSREDNEALSEVALEYFITDNQEEDFDKGKSISESTL